MRSAIWSTLVSMTCSPPCACGWLWCGVVTRGHAGKARQRGEEPAALGLLVGGVGELLADDAGGDDGPVADDVVDRHVGAEGAVLLQPLEPRGGQCHQPD